MKKLIIFIFCLNALCVYGQPGSTQYLGSPNTVINQRGWFKNDSGFVFPNRDTARAPYYIGETRYNPSDEILYIAKSLTARKWRPVNESILAGSVSGVSSVNTSIDGTVLSITGGGTGAVTLAHTWNAAGTDVVLGNGSYTPYSTLITGITDPLYSPLGHTHASADITDLTTVVRNMFSGGTDIDVNTTTGVITYTGTGGGGGSGNPNSNIGSGYRWAVPFTNNIKTVFGASGVLIDSSSNSNALTFKVDTIAIATRGRLYKVVDSSIAALGLTATENLAHNSMTANGDYTQDWATHQLWFNNVDILKINSGTTGRFGYVGGKSLSLGFDIYSQYDDNRGVYIATLNGNNNGSQIYLNAFNLPGGNDNYIDIVPDKTTIAPPRGALYIDTVLTSSGPTQKMVTWDSVARKIGYQTIPTGGVTTTTDNNLKIVSTTISTNKAIQTLTYGATTTMNVANGYNAKVTLTGNTTLTITNAQEGDYIAIDFYQDATGGNVVTFPSNSVFLGSDAINTEALLLTSAVAKYDGTDFIWTLSNTTTGGGGGIASINLFHWRWKVGHNGKPSIGDSTWTEDSLVSKFVQVYRNGYRLYEGDFEDGFEIDTTTGKITLHPVLSANESVIVEAWPTSYWSIAKGFGGGAGPSWQDMSPSTDDNVAETSSGSKIWIGTSGVDDYNDEGLFNKFLAAGDDGKIRLKVDASDGVGAWLGFNTTNASAAYTGMEAGFVALGGFIYRTDNGSFGGPVGTYSVGDYIAVDRTGSTLKLQKSSNGTTWTDVYTYSFTSSNNLYIVGSWNGLSGKMYYPQVYNGQ